jgi:integrase
LGRRRYRRFSSLNGALHFLDVASISVLVITLAFTGMRWSEMIGLAPAYVSKQQVGIEWKLYELNGRFYRGRPKDGSIRPADLPPFLADLLARQIDAFAGRTCTCRNSAQSWCPGDRYVFLGPDGGHFRRSNYSARFLRPAADGWHPAHGKRAAAPVLIDATGFFPGRPLPSWPAAVPGEPFVPPAGKGLVRLTSDATIGRCPACGHALRRRLNGRLITHNASEGRCQGSGQLPAEDATIASWLPILPGVTAHGLRHSHQTWMDEARIADLLKSERMGHEVPGMCGVYGHISPAMRAEQRTALQELWETSLRDRAQLSSRSSVPLVDTLLQR